MSMRVHGNVAVILVDEGSPDRGANEQLASVLHDTTSTIVYLAHLYVLL
jgi:hypothetical protein